jgi:hypothetical protein
MNVSLPLLASRRFLSRALVAFALLLACAPPEAARAQGVCGPTAPTVSPADAVALARCCGGDGGIPIALALQADRFAEWAGRWDHATEVGGGEAFWLRLATARRGADGAIVPADAPGVLAAARAVRDDIAAQRQADRALLEAIVTNACAGADGPSLAAARARAAALMRRPMLVEIGRRGVPLDPLQFLECDPGVVARLESLGAGEALRAAGRDMEESLSARQFAAIAREADAAARGTRLDPVSEGLEADRASSDAVERAARSIGALDPAAGAWIRLRAATDHASNFPRPPLSAAEVESRIGAFPGEAEPEAAEQWRRRHDALVEQVRTERERLEEVAKQLQASLVGLVTSRPTPGLVALGARIAPDANAVASCLRTDACIGKGGIASLVSRAEAVLRDVASAVPDPRPFAVTPAEIYRLASWQVEQWSNNRIIDVEGCGCCGILVHASGGPVVAELVTVDTAAIAGFGPVDRMEFCRKLESLAAERSAIQPGSGDPEAADALRSVMARLRTVIVGQFATAVAALPPADSAPAARAAALRDWALLSHPGLRRMYDDAAAATRRAAESDADARVALMDSAIAAAMERIVSGSRSASSRDSSEHLRWTLRGSSAMRMAANAIEQAAAKVRQEASDGPAEESEDPSSDAPAP